MSTSNNYNYYNNEQSNSWLCPVCTHNNASTSNICEMCGKRSPFHEEEIRRDAPRQYQRRSYTNHRRRPKPNIYQKRLSAQRRNKLYKHQNRSNHDYLGNDASKDYYTNYYENRQIDKYSGDENESVDSQKKWKKLRSEISSIFIPSNNKNEAYDANGHIMYLTAIDNSNINEFDLTRFIRTITNYDGSNVMQRAKLLKVEVIQPEQPENNNNINSRYPINKATPKSNPTLKLRITVSSPHIFQKLLNQQNQQYLCVNDITYKYDIPSIYEMKSKCVSLKLCIKPCCANQDFAIWSSSSDYYQHAISYYIENRDEIPGIYDGIDNRLFVYIGGDKETEYELTINPKDIYYVEYRSVPSYIDMNGNQHSTVYYIKLRLLRPCLISKLPITPNDRSYQLIFPPPNDEYRDKMWINCRGKIYRQCGNEHIYNDSQINHNEAIYHRHAEYNDFHHDKNNENIKYKEDEIETSLEMLPKMIGKSLILFFEFDGKSEPQQLLKWVNAHKPSHYNYLSISSSLICPSTMHSANIYRDNLLPLRGGNIVAECIVDYIDMLINEARIADEYVMHEQELNDKFLNEMMNYKIRSRFDSNNKENIDQALMRYTLQYYSCHTVENLKNKIIQNADLKSFRSNDILQFLLNDTKNRIISRDGGNLLITAPFDNHNTIEIKRVLVTPTRVIMCPPEHWPLSNIFRWIVDNKNMDNLLFVSFVTEDFDPYPCYKLNANNNSYFGFILKKYILNGMDDGRITIFNRTYHYLFSTPELFRYRTLCFFQASKYLVGKHVRTMQLLNRICRTQLTTNGVMTHWATQRFIPSICSIKGKYIIHQQIDYDHYPLYTEGIGVMPMNWSKNTLYNMLLNENNQKLSLYRLDIDEYPHGHCPTLIRFAYKGYFGVLTLNPFINEDKFLFRKSQKRYRFQQSDDMEIYSFSYWKPGYLKPNIIFILQQLGIDCQIIYKLVKNRLKLLNYARYDDTAAIHLLSGMDILDIPCIISTEKGYSFNNSIWIKAFGQKLLEEREVFLTKFVQIIIENELRILRSEYKLILEYKDAALLYGCIDELKILKKNQVFIQTFDKERNEWEIWRNINKYNKILIYNENHVYYAGDVILMDCYNDDKEINKLSSIYKNVVVFPHPSNYNKHETPIFFQCGGATLNGENQFICIRNEKMIPSNKKIRDNINNDYIKYPPIIMNERGRVIQQQINDEHETKGHEEEQQQQQQPDIPLHDQPVCEQNIMEYAYNTLANDSIDYEILEYLWLSHADKDTPNCLKCKEISYEIYKAKKYHLLQMKLNDIAEYECDAFPSWIQFKAIKKIKCKKINFKTRSVMYWIKHIIDKKYKEYKLASRTLGYDVILKSNQEKEEEIIKRCRYNGHELCDVHLMHELDVRLAQQNNNDSQWKYILNDEQFISEILDLKKAFEFDLFLRCKQYGIINECELLTYKLLDLKTKQISFMNWNEYQLLLLKRKQFLCGRNESYSMKIVLSKMTHDMILHFRRKLIYGINGNIDNKQIDVRSDRLYAKSLYIYHLIYKQNFEIVNSKQNYPFPSLLFAWILADYWLAIKDTVKKQSNHNNMKKNIDINLNYKHKNQLYFTPGFIGDSMSHKKQILIDHEKEEKIESEKSTDDNYGFETKHCPIPNFIEHKENMINYNQYHDHDDNDDNDDKQTVFKHKDNGCNDDLNHNEHSNDNQYENDLVIENYDDIQKFFGDKMETENRTNYKNLDSLLKSKNDNDDYSYHRSQIYPRNDQNEQSVLHYIPHQQQQNNQQNNNQQYNHNNYYNKNRKIRTSAISPHMMD